MRLASHKTRYARPFEWLAGPDCALPLSPIEYRPNQNPDQWHLQTRLEALDIRNFLANRKKLRIRCANSQFKSVVGTFPAWSNSDSEGSKANSGLFSRYLYPDDSRTAFAPVW